MTRWPRPDFLQRATRPPALAWLVLAAAALALALNLFDALAMRASLAEQRARVAKATQGVAQARPSSASASASAGAPDSAAAQSAMRVSARLDHPWGNVLGALEASTPAGVQWLLFDHDSERPEVRLEGQAADVATVLQVIEELSARVGWSDVVLTRLQAPDARAAVPGSTGMRFEIGARLDASRIAPPPAQGRS